MSLNWKEIDLVLSELDLLGAKIERVVQPSYDSLCLSLYKGYSTELFFSIAQGACRLHRLSSSPPKPERALRFQECLKARLIGGKVEGIRQLGSERIVRIDITAPRNESIGSKSVVYKTIGAGARKSWGGSEDDKDVSPTTRYILYARLWSGAGNILLVGEDGSIVDVLARRPKRGELSGEACRVEEEAAGAKSPTKVFEVRELSAPSESVSFNEKVEAFYAAQGGALSREKLLESARETFGKKRRALETRIAELEARAAEFHDAGRLRELGDILMANQGLSYEGKYLECDDFYRGGRVRIPVDPKLSIVDNAREFYERQHKAKSGLADVEDQLRLARSSLEKLGRELASIEATGDPFLIARALAKGGAGRKESGGGPGGERSYPGLSLEVASWTILIGRSAKENDELLRHNVRGSDLWLHARDWAGSYVFIKARRDKSVPLEVLLDAAQLAIYYSKGRANGGGDLYYTQAKYLRRAKNGPVGLVLPTHEKNLSVRISDARIKELRSLIGEED
jgi:predicted ribosome quality control (RQC) complex YloA/Tae2 family protein